MVRDFLFFLCKFVLEKKRFIELSEIVIRGFFFFLYKCDCDLKKPFIELPEIVIRGFFFFLYKFVKKEKKKKATH